MVAASLIIRMLIRTSHEKSHGHPVLCRVSPSGAGRDVTPRRRLDWVSSEHLSPALQVSSGAGPKMLIPHESTLLRSDSQVHRTKSNALGGGTMTTRGYPKLNLEPLQVKQFHNKKTPCTLR